MCELPGPNQMKNLFYPFAPGSAQCFLLLFLQDVVRFEWHTVLPADQTNRSPWGAIHYNPDDVYSANKYHWRYNLMDARREVLRRMDTETYPAHKILVFRCDYLL